jgi:mono/diheme cytochrome c family protein
MILANFNHAASFAAKFLKLQKGRPMPSNLRIFLCAAALLAVAVVACTGTPQAQTGTPSAQKSAAPKAAASASSPVARGKYIVTEVAKCQECHTPRDEQGNEDDSRWLQGSPIWIMPVHPTSNWAMNAPAIAGFLGFTDHDGYMIFEKGMGPNGIAIRPPMHIYHMNHEDAVAVIAYLRSLPAPPQ